MRLFVPASSSIGRQIHIASLFVSVKPVRFGTDERELYF